MLAELRNTRREYETDRQVIWQPNLARLLPPLIKNAQGHLIYELGERTDRCPASAVVCALQSLDEGARAAFEAVSIGAAWPEVGSRMMFRR
jgi:hypothetical protein